MATKTATRAPAKPAGRATPPKRPPSAGRPSPARDESEDRRPARTPATVPAAARTAPETRSRDVSAYRGGAVKIARPGQAVAFADEDRGKGAEAFGRDDMDIPRLKLMQGLSPELETFNDLRPGNFFHTATEAIFDRPFLAVPVFMDRRYILWNPRDAGGGILARADDSVHWDPPDAEFEVTLDKKDGGAQVTWKTARTVRESGLADWGTMNPDDPKSPPAATLMYNFLLAFPEHPDMMPAVLTFQRTSIKTGRKFVSKLKTNRDPAFGLVFEFSSFKAKNARGQEFWNMQATAAGKLQETGPGSFYAMCREQYEALTRSGLKIKDIEGLGDEPGSEGDDGAADDGGRPGY